MGSKGSGPEGPQVHPGCPGNPEDPEARQRRRQLRLDPWDFHPKTDPSTVPPAARAQEGPSTSPALHTPGI